MIQNQIKRDIAKEFEDTVDKEEEKNKCYVLCSLCFYIYDSYKYLRDGIAISGLDFFIINPSNKFLIVI